MKKVLFVVLLVASAFPGVLSATSRCRALGADGRGIAFDCVALI
jgi:hypothetical protein